VVAPVVVAGIVAGLDTTYTLVTKKSPPAPVERAEMTDGVSGPSRQFFRCMPDGRCIAPDYVTIDSIANDPFVGNEAYFMTAKVLGSANPMQTEVSVKVGETVLVRALIVNDAAINAPGGHPLVAHGTRFILGIPTNSSSELPLSGRIYSSNAIPQLIHDTVFLHGKTRFTIEYDWGSAVLANRSHRGLPLSDEIIGEGDLVGSGMPNGMFPPGLANNAAVFVLVHVLPASV